MKRGRRREGEGGGGGGVGGPLEKKKDHGNSLSLAQQSINEEPPSKGVRSYAEEQPAGKEVLPVQG